MDYPNYHETVHVSIKVLYSGGGSSIYYRDLCIGYLANWIEAHKFTHPDAVEYNVRLILTEDK